MDSSQRRRARKTPERFLSVRGQQTSGSAASSGDDSPHLSSYRHTMTPSRARRRRRQALAAFQSDDDWPAFSDAARQGEDSDFMIGGRQQRGGTGRATDTNARATLPTAQAVSPSRRLRSEPGAAVASGSTSTPLSPTASDWVPSTGLSPAFSSRSYADVVRIGDGRPPPPFPILGRPNAARASIANTGIAAGPSAKGSSASGSEMNSTFNVDKETSTTTGASNTSASNMENTASADLPSGHQSPSSSDSEDDREGQEMATGGYAMSRTDQPIEKLQAEQEADEARFADMRRKADLAGWGASPFLPQSRVEYKRFRDEVAAEAKKHEESRTRMLEQELRTAAAGAAPGDASVRPAFRPIDGLSCVLARQTTFSEVPPPSRRWDVIRWPSSLELPDAGRDGHFHVPPPRQSRVHGEHEFLGSPVSNYDHGLVLRYRAEEAVPDRWDWLSPAEQATARSGMPAEIDEDDVHGPLQELLDFIHKPGTWNA